MSVVCTAPTDATDLLAEVQSGDLGGLPAAPEQSGQVPGPAEPEEAQGQPHQHGLLQAHGQVGLRRVQKGRVLRNTSQEDSDSLIENAHASVADSIYYINSIYKYNCLKVNGRIKQLYRIKRYTLN